MITKSELIKRVAQATDGVLTQRQAEVALDAMAPVMVQIVKEQESVRLFNGVTISGSLKEAHTARNPATGDPVEVPDKIVPKAKFTNGFKKLINGAEETAED